MKNKLLKIIPIILMGVSLSACTILSDLGIGGKSDITKFAKHKNEVSLEEFVDKAKGAIKDTEYVKDDYKMPDSKLIAGVKASATQKLTNPNFANKTRNEASAKLNVSANASFDRETDSLKANASASYNVSEKNAAIGEGSTKYETKADFTFMPNGKDVTNHIIYAVVDNNNKMYRNVVVQDGFNLGQTLSFGMNYLMNSLSTLTIGGTFNEAEFNKQLAQYGLSLKYYDDSNVMTVTAKWDHTFELREENYHYENIWNEELGYYEYVKVVDSIERYGSATVKADLKFQFKVVKVVKLRALFDGDLTAEYYSDHTSAYNNVWPFGFSGLSGDCNRGDQETIYLKVEAGVNLEHEKVEHKLPELTNYQNVTTK